MAESQLGSTKSPITMKVDGPPEDTANRENEENERNEDKILGINPSHVCSPFSKPILTGSKLNSVANNFKSASGSVLRPSLFNASSSGLNNLQNKPIFTLNPSRLNPFAKVPVDDNSLSCDNSEEGKQSKQENEQDSKNVNGDTPKFIPLVQDNEKHAQENRTESTVTPVTTSQSSIAGRSNFVFGQNLKDRVVTGSGTEEPKASSSNCNNANGTSEMLFTYALKENSTTSESTNVMKKENKSLSESAREYEEARAVKRKYEEVEVRTGEEGETNVLQLSCKLFAYDKSTGGSWQERGRGTLRLNDQDIGEKVQSRLVFRTSGSLRVILNTKIWSDMSIQLASTKSIRLTAFDNNGDVRVFLVMGNPEDIKQLYKHLEIRVKREKDSQHEEVTKNLIPESESESSPKKLAVDTGGD